MQSLNLKSAPKAINFHALVFLAEDKFQLFRVESHRGIADHRDGDVFEAGDGLFGDVDVLVRGDAALGDYGEVFDVTHCDGCAGRDWRCGV